jgi:hypothetical protein
MSNVTEERFNVSSDDVRRYSWHSTIFSCGKHECTYYHEYLLAESRQLKEAGDTCGASVFALLSVVASFHPNYDAPGNPYGSMWSGFKGKRSLNAEDLSTQDLTTLGGVVNEIADPELRARVADVLWVTTRNHKKARLAIAAFLESAQRLKRSDSWSPYAERLERAARLAAIRGFEKEKTEVTRTVELAIAEYAPDPKSGLLAERLMGTLALLVTGDPSEYASLSEKLARGHSSESNWHFAEHYWERAELWHRKAKNATEAQRCQIARAETYISRAEAGLSGRGTNYMYSAHWMSKGLEALRRAKADSARITSVHMRFLELQKLSLNEMGAIELPIEKMQGVRAEEKKAQESATRHVQGVDFPTAIARFAFVNRPTSKAEMEKQLAATTESAPLINIIGVSALDRAGKVTDVIPPQLPNDSVKNDEAARKQMVQQAKMVNWPLHVTWCIEPARIAIQQEHAVRLRDLWFLVENNPLIPTGHEGIYLRGIQAGFFGEWLWAMHLLVPQIEASIRQVLQLRGVITSTVNGEGLQEERDLNQLLWMKETEDVFGQDILFDLRGILIERFGHNLRNELAHGLVPENGFYNAAPVYLWWLVIHVLWRGYHFVQSQSPEAESPDKTDTMAPSRRSE